MSKGYDVAIVGATGLVGATTVEILEERRFPINKIYFVASHRSTGSAKEFRGKWHPVEDLSQFDFSKTQLSFFCAGKDISKEYAPKAAATGNIVIDKSSCFRTHDDVPLIVPEVNSHAIQQYLKMRIIANPNCTTIPMVVALKPLYDAVGLVRINVATYQSVSGTGKDAVGELAEQTAECLNGRPANPKIYSQQIAFNVLPHCDDFQTNGYTEEEMKIIVESRKILNDNSIAINPTAVRVPVFYGHSIALHIETKDKITAKNATELLAKAPGVQILNVPTPVKDAAGNDNVFVGRIREDISHKNGLNLWVVTDNLRKGAALNGVQIAEQLIQSYL